MTNPSSSNHLEGFAINRSPFFMETDYPYWKTWVIWFLQLINLDLWDDIEDGITIPLNLVDGVMVSKAKQEWDKHDRRKVKLNAKGIYFLQCAIDRNEYNRVCQCKSAKEIGDCLMTHEGTNQAKE